MQRYLWTSLLCGLLVGCGSITQEEETAPDETVSRPQPADSLPTPNAEGKALPAAPMPQHQLFAKNFINKPAPKFVVQEWLTKEPDRKGKMVMIDFWATWCKPCVESIPKLNKFHRNHEDRLAVIGVSDEPADIVRNHPGGKINYAIAIDTKGRMTEAIRNQFIPYIVLIDPTGVVRWQGSGNYMTEEVLEEMLDTYVQ